MEIRTARLEKFWWQLAVGHIKRTRGCAPRPFVSRFADLIALRLVLHGVVLLFVSWPAAGCSRAARAPRHAFRRGCFLVPVLVVRASLRSASALRAARLVSFPPSDSFVVLFDWPLRGLFRGVSAARSCAIPGFAVFCSPPRCLFVSLRAPPWDGGFFRLIIGSPLVSPAAGGQCLVALRVLVYGSFLFVSRRLRLLLFNSSSGSFLDMFPCPELCAAMVRGRRGFIRVWGMRPGPAGSSVGA
ncbi:hypothetical protein ABIB45_000693 [Arthrobacter sp. UYCo732]